MRSGKRSWTPDWMISAMSTIMSRAPTVASPVRSSPRTPFAFGFCSWRMTRTWKWTGTPSACAASQNLSSSGRLVGPTLGMVLSQTPRMPSRRRVGGELPGLAALAVGHHLGRLVVELARHVLPPEMRRLQDVRVGGDQLVRAGHRGCPPARAIQTNVRSFQGACYKRAMHAPVLYMVKAWVSPDGGERYLRWLEEKHMAEVIREPGFLWAQRCRLEQRDEQGWLGYLLMPDVPGLEPAGAIHAVVVRGTSPLLPREEEAAAGLLAVGERAGVERETVGLGEAQHVLEEVPEPGRVQVGSASGARGVDRFVLRLRAERRQLALDAAAGEEGVRAVVGEI